MSILKIAKMGHPVLRIKAEPVSIKKIKSPEIQWLIDSMIETMYDAGGVGLAAPQVYESLQILVMEIPDEDESKAAPLTVIINPEVEMLTDTKIRGWEGCLSIPDIWGEVARYKDIRLRYYDRQGNRHELECHDFKAVVVQHEYDHLVATLFIDRVDDTTKLAFTKEYRTYFGKAGVIKS